MNLKIKTIEDLSLNAWPSHQMQIYDGWILRFSYFYTHRTNSVEQIGESTIPLDQKIDYCESIYRQWGTPAIFKISPLVSGTFDDMLEKRGYVIQHSTDVMTMDLDQYAPTAVTHPVTISSFIPAKWINSLFALKGTTNIMHKLVVPSMYRAIPKETICASILDGGKVVATGLGILDRNYIGLYAIHVHPEYRGRGYAHSMCTAILQKGMEKGADSAYLQVVKGNSSAVSLYRSLGFQYFYTYWFRTRHLQ
ncbi:MAG TPA: GNAT family N-acetyltransferase [Candidatus Pelethocola excrementipullorum]|nr:GNAT family N-acetyltransferase [Candidatus Pelethocola excrementipullorum]